MKKLIIILLLSNFTFSQSYFDGNQLNCQTQNAEAKKNFQVGVKLLHLNKDLDPKYLMKTANVFASAVLKDTMFCDAYFFAGYTLSLLNKNRETYAFYKVADSLSPQPFFLYKLNTAAVCIKLDRYKEARKFYTDMVKYFPTSPEGYYGIAVTSPMLGDYSNGLDNINIALKKYVDNFQEVTKDAMFLKAVLLTINEKYEDAIPIFKDVYSIYKKDLNFNIHYSLALLKLSDKNNDEDLKKEALKYYKKIENKEAIPMELRERFTF